ncbi:MAG: HAD family phosphatase [Anaerolineaceae bacterium]|jgi:HAD superfamily hydrolase (TIGR01509 family)|nr:MAG: HAD family phosphatase [Anaerolineaceae bacterium]
MVANLSFSFLWKFDTVTNLFNARFHFFGIIPAFRYQNEEWNTMMKDALDFSACIFDFDGILVDSEVVLVKLWGRAAAEYGFTFRKEHFLPCLGRTAEDIKQIQIDQFGKDYPFDAIYQKVQQYFRETIQMEGLPLVEGALDIRQYLEDLHIKMAVASSTYRDEVLYRMEKAGIAHLFAVVLGGDEIEYPKPAPDIFLKAARCLQVEPSGCLVLEDSQNGVLAAKSAGMRVMVVQNLSPVTEIMREKADAVFPSHSALLQYLKSVKHPLNS